MYTLILLALPPLTGLMQKQPGYYFTSLILFVLTWSFRELTKVLLDNDFDIKFEMPIDRLCPTVTNRYLIDKFSLLILLIIN